MNRKYLTTLLSLIITITISAIASIWDINSMWGLNYHQFLPSQLQYGFILLLLLSLFVLFLPIKNNSNCDIFEKLSINLWGRNPWLRIVISFSFLIFFYTFQTQTFFLGDGYTIFSHFEKGSDFVPKWSEYGSSLIIRELQSYLGGYTRKTVMQAFQIVSICSGVIIVYNIIVIAGKISSSLTSKFIALVTLLFSGLLLLFCGYVEHYALLWMVITFFFRFSLSYIIEERLLWLSIISFIVAVFIHVEAIIFIGGIAYLLYLKLHKKNHNINYFPKSMIIILVGFITTGILLLIIRENFNLEKIILPLLRGPNHAPDYALFSSKHLFDIVNLIFLMFPAVLIIFGLLLSQPIKWITNKVSLYLLLLSGGSLLFLFLIDPLLGMARDWDLMSLTLFAPYLLVINQLNFEKSKRSIQIVIAVSLICVSFSMSYIATNIFIPNSGDRFASLLNYYGMKDEIGWSFYSNYLIKINEYDRAKNITEQMLEKGIREFSSHKNLAELYKETNQLDLSESHYSKALRLKPKNSLVILELAQLLLQKGDYQKALVTFKNAQSLKPDDDLITDGISLAYLHLGYLDSATVIADSLFIKDSNSSQGHIISLIVSIKQNNLEKAKYHFSEFIKYGKNRNDYIIIKKQYEYLLK